MAKQHFPSGLPARAEKTRAPKSNSSAAERLQKVLASAGLGSRRKCEEMIQEGRVEVDGKIVMTLGTKVDPDSQKILVDGEPLPTATLEYYAVNKPTGVVTTNYDQEGRPRVIDLVPDGERLFPIGRLDQYSEGLILVTNDGALTNRLAHPRYGVEKTYHAIVAGSPDPETLDKLRQGVHLAEGFAHAKQVTVRQKGAQSTLIEIVLDEGRNREIRRMLARVGHKVLKLRRIAIGSLKIGELAPGEWRKLTPREVEMLYAMAPQALPAPRKRRPRAGSRLEIARPAARPAEKGTKRFGERRSRGMGDVGKGERGKSSSSSGPRKVQRRPKPVKRQPRELPGE